VRVDARQPHRAGHHPRRVSRRGRERCRRRRGRILDSFKFVCQGRPVPTDDDLTRALRDTALRVTAPRVAVLAAVHAHPHADTDTVLRAARATLGGVSHQAVYDVLRVLTEAGLVRRIEPAGSVARYEARTGQREREPGDRLARTQDTNRRPPQPGLVAQPARPAGPPPALARSNPLKEDFDYKEAFAEPRRRGAQAGPHRGDDHLAGLVAGRLRPLRPAVHPDELARRRHLPHRGRPRRRRRRLAALRAAQQLARQRQPRQGPPAAVAGQAEVRPQDLLGRPARARRQRRPRDMGFETFGFGFGREDIWEPEEIFWGPRTPGSATSATAATASDRSPRRRADGPDLRQPRGPQRQPDPLASARTTSARPSAAWP
jgi:DNA-binding transcriptional ArsR family regulator